MHQYQKKLLTIKMGSGPRYWVPVIPGALENVCSPIHKYLPLTLAGTGASKPLFLNLEMEKLQNIGVRMKVDTRTMKISTLSANSVST